LSNIVLSTTSHPLKVKKVLLSTPMLLTFAQPHLLSHLPASVSSMHGCSGCKSIIASCYGAWDHPGPHACCDKTSTSTPLFRPSFSLPWHRQTFPAMCVCLRQGPCAQVDWNYCERCRETSSLLWRTQGLCPGQPLSLSLCPSSSG
jgi:hypothetical protein